jgi:hypothetical protein
VGNKNMQQRLRVSWIRAFELQVMRGNSGEQKEYMNDELLD